MTRVISVANQKGGVGKSTTAHALGAGLHHAKYKVLTIDLDPQGNTTYSTIGETQEATIYNFLKGEATAAEVIKPAGHGDIIPSNGDLALLDKELSSTGKEYRLKEELELIKANYDYIIIDTPPTLGTLTINALTASDYIVIPAQADIYSLQGIGQLYQTVEAVKKYTNPTLIINGILITRYDNRAILSRDLKEMLGDAAQTLQTFVYKNPIREGIAVKEAQAEAQDIFTYAPKSNAAQDYIAFIKEFIGKVNEHEQKEF